MESMTLFREFAQTAAPLAVAMLWQGLVVVAGLALCFQLAERVPARDQFRAWAAGFAALLALPLLHYLGAIHGVASSASFASEAPTVTHAWFDVDPRWALAIAGVWIAASLFRFADLTVHAIRLRAVCKQAEPMERSFAVTGRAITVCASRQVDRPSVIGFFRPRVLIPAWLLQRLTPVELEQVVLHEAEHLRRRDDWTNLVQKLALVLFPLNPALVWIERELCHQREMACDDAVIHATGKPRAYAACLTSLAERGLERRREALNLGAWSKRHELVGRVHRILRQSQSLNPLAARALLVVIGSGLAVGSVELARAPQMIAFVARPVAIAQSNVPDRVNIDGRAVAGYRAINAVAHIPERAAIANLDNRTTRKHSLLSTKEATEQTQPVRSSDASAFLVDQAVASKTPEATNRNGQWLVLTALEQVVTVRRQPTTVADYDVNQAAAVESADQAASGAVTAAANAGDAPAQQWTETQVILRAIPADNNSRDSGAQNAGDPQSNSQSAQPTVISVPDGWLVLQL